MAKNHPLFAFALKDSQRWPQCAIFPAIHYVTRPHLTDSENVAQQPFGVSGRAESTSSWPKKGFTKLPNPSNNFSNL